MTPISKMETTQTAVEWLIKKLESQYIKTSGPYDVKIIFGFEDIEQAKEMEREQCIKDYNAGYTDAQCNHINDAENYANEREYVK
jgi:hypothetical protein